jgi:mono/diheme cytochrome c family protein
LHETTNYTLLTMRLLMLLFVCLAATGTFAQAKKIAKPAATRPASQSVAVSPGAAVYKQYCLTCHQVDGGGVPNLNPPLSGTDWVVGDKNRLIGVLLNGLQNAEIEGETYDNVMPAHDFLTDQQLADVLTYIRSNFGNKAIGITPGEVKAQRKK